MRTSLLGSPTPALFSNLGSPDGSTPDLERTGSRSSTWEDTINDSYSKQEPGAKNLWKDTGMISSSTRLTVPFVTPEAQFWFVNPGPRNTERSEDVLHHSGRSWLQNYENLSLNTTAIDFRAQVLNIYDRRNGVGKQVFKLVQLDTNSFSMSWLLGCVRLILLMMCCNK